MTKLKFFRWAGIGLLIVGLAVVIGLLLFQRQIAEAVIGRVVDREVNILGDIALRLGLMPNVRVTHLTIENASWATHNNFLEVETAILSLDPESLRRHGRISAELNLASPSVYLERSRTGEANCHTTASLGETSGFSLLTQRWTFKMV